VFQELVLANRDIIPGMPGMPGMSCMPGVLGMECVVCLVCLVLRPGDKDRKITFNMTRGSSPRTRSLLARSFIPHTRDISRNVILCCYSVRACVTAKSRFINDMVLKCKIK